jgi:hypothetical protein
MSQKYVCLKCGHRWKTRTICPSRCANSCGSSFVLPEDRYCLLLQILKNQINRDMPLLEHFEALKIILMNFGFRGRPLEVLVFLQGLLRQAQSFEKAETVTEEQ